MECVQANQLQPPHVNWVCFLSVSRDCSISILGGRSFKLRQTILFKLKARLIINLAWTCTCTVHLQNEESNAQVCSKVAYVRKVHIPRSTRPLITYHNSKEPYVATPMYRYVAVHIDMIRHLKPVSASEL
jgi:hypothetical protein